MQTDIEVFSQQKRNPWDSAVDGVGPQYSMTIMGARGFPSRNESQNALELLGKGPVELRSEFVGSKAFVDPHPVRPSRLHCPYATWGAVDIDDTLGLNHVMY